MPKFKKYQNLYPRVNKNCEFALLKGMPLNIPRVGSNDALYAKSAVSLKISNPKPNRYPNLKLLKLS